MTETTATPEAPEAETTVAEDATPVKMHRFSTYLHVGPGAEECEHREDGACTERDHFHGWCRLPNQFERDTLREKAGAAAARRLRILRDEDSDMRVILDGELEALKARDDRDSLIEEITGKNFLEDHLRALQEVAEENEDYKTIDDDRERLRALEEMAEDERPTEEFEHLQTHIKDHTDLVNARRDDIEEPRREAVKEKTIDELCDIVREQRIDALGNASRTEAYSKWEWYICTFKPKPSDKGFPNERVFPHINEFTAAPPEVLEAIATTITDLEKEANDSLKG